MMVCVIAAVYMVGDGITCALGGSLQVCAAPPLSVVVVLVYTQLLLILYICTMIFPYFNFAILLCNIS